MVMLTETIMLTEIITLTETIEREMVMLTENGYVHRDNYVT